MTQLPISEADFGKWLADAARSTGWAAYHFHDSRRQVKPGVFVGDKDAAGVCDWILLHDDPALLIFAELKDEDGKPTDEQAKFLRLARDVAEVSWTPLPTGFSRRTIGVYLWKPVDRPIIEQILTSKVLL